MILPSYVVRSAIEDGQRAAFLSAGRLRSYIRSFHEKTTSSAVNGVPSLNFTSCRSLNVQVTLSSATAQLSASPGSSSPVNELPRVRPSKMR